MTGSEHYREAERLMSCAGRPDEDGPYYMDDQAPTLAAAQVHATLALVAALHYGARTRAEKLLGIGLGADGTT